MRFCEISMGLLSRCGVNFTLYNLIWKFLTCTRGERGGLAVRWKYPSRNLGLYNMLVLAGYTLLYNLSPEY